VDDKTAFYWCAIDTDENGRLVPATMTEDQEWSICIDC